MATFVDMIKKWLGLTPPPDYAEMLRKGAVIVDVRTKNEFAGGHIRGSLNLPLQSLSEQKTKHLPNKNQIIITCCASGMRSASAKKMLQASGYTQVYNAGSWSKLQQYLI
jgi:rhodanese-related sulfurtransferase